VVSADNRQRSGFTAQGLSLPPIHVGDSSDKPCSAAAASERSWSIIRWQAGCQPMVELSNNDREVALLLRSALMDNAHNLIIVV
jgi:hypothetical protein